MSYSNILYGVTMPEQGVSKRIAIKFEEIERHLPMDVIEKQAAEKREESIAQADAAKPAESVPEAAAEPAPAPQEQSVQ
jgi:hypothetical protein